MHQTPIPAVPRSARSEVRNPVLALPALAALQQLPADSRKALADLLMDLRSDASARAQHAWSTRKPPVAAYWAATAVYAGHIARAIRKVTP